jgi:hypothetical protein
LGAAAVCVERAGEFLAQRLSKSYFGVLNIAEAAVSPSSVTEFKRLNRRLCSSSAAY